MIADHTMLYRWQGNNDKLKPILLTAHYDTVPVVPGSENDLTHPPFAGVVANDHVWGRGAHRRVASTESVAFKLLSRVTRKIYGNVIVVPGLTVGGTDSKH